MICSASIAHLAGNTMPTPPIAPWGQYGSVLRLLPPWGQYGSVLRLLPRGGNTAPRPPLAGMAVARRDANDYFLLWRSHSMALMRNALLSSSL